MENMILAVIEVFKVLSTKCYVLYIFIKEKIISMVNAIRNAFTKKTNKKFN